MTESPQNVYDDPSFLAGYAQLERFGAGWSGALEQPMFLALLPDVRDLRVLDLGCGLGQLSVYLAEQGAREVLGVDVSAQMLARAAAHPRVTFVRAPIEDLVYADERFDLVVSSLALHYVADYRAIVQRLARWLTPRGVLVFSTEHPLFTARLPHLGWVLDDAGARTAWAIDDYGREGARIERWFVDGVRKYHRTLATLVNGLVEAGFVVERLVEPVPDQERERARPNEADEWRRPTFLLVRARRAG